MERTTPQPQPLNGLRAAIYARVSDKSQAEEDKTSLSEQTSEMDAYCERKGLTVVARYQEVGQGWSKKRPEFQRMLADAKRGRFDTIVCWKSDRLSRGMYPAAALMEVVEAYQMRLESVMDAIDMKTFGLMAAIGKIELDNFRERAELGKRGSAKQGRIPVGSIPYGYRIGDDGRPYVHEPEAVVVRRVFHQYVHEGEGVPSITRQLAEDDAPTAKGSQWGKNHVHRILGREAYKGTWWYGKARYVSTEDGKRITKKPRDSWIEVPFPPLVDERTWERAQELKRQRLKRSKRNTKVFYLLQHLVKCAECGMYFGGRALTSTSQLQNGKRYRYAIDPPLRYYRCFGMTAHSLDCRRPATIRAERLEELVWTEVKKVVQHPDLIVAAIESLDAQGGDGWDKQIAKAERDLWKVQTEEDRAIRLFVSGKITEEQLDLQRRFITERLETLQTKLDDYRGQESTTAQKRLLMENIVEWARTVGDGLDNLPEEGRRDLLKLLLEQVVIDKDNNVRLTLGIPTENLVSIANPQQRAEHDQAAARGEPAF